MNQIERSKEMFASSYANFLQGNWTDSNSRLHQSIRYCLEGGGKRVRALLSMLVSEAYGKDPRVALSAAVAVEMVHAYSLAHDDLPCMDNDDMRRGRPSLHKAFDDCTALLAGDAILTDAFRVLVDEDFFADTSVVSVSDRLKLVQELAVAAGSQGMVYGQDKDIFWTAKNNFKIDDLESIHRSKTGSLIGAATAMGAISAGAPTADVHAWREFGILIGLAFQAIDDALDDTDSTGKTANKDEIQNKLTYMRIYTRGEVVDLARRHTDLAISFIPAYVKKDELVGFINSLLARRS